MNSSYGRALLILLAAVIVPACGGGRVTSGNGSGGNPPAVNTGVIAGPGGFTISTAGGDATTGWGGVGGSIDITGASGSPVNVLGGAQGVDTSFTVPTITPYLGTNPHVATTGTVDLNLTAGILRGTVSPALPATGLHVPAGVTLTLSDSSATTQLIVQLSNSVHIEGTLAMAEVSGGSLNALEFFLECSNFFVSPTGSVLAVGAPSIAASTPAGAGGGLHISVAGMSVLAGSIMTAGGSAGGATSTGGSGGDIFFTAGEDLYLTGSVHTEGGSTSGSSSTAGSGGTVYIDNTASTFLGLGVTGGTFTSGTIATSGGTSTGPSSAPGVGGNIFYGLLSQGGYRLVFSGTLQTSGGSSPTTGGGSGEIMLSCNLGPIRISGSLSSRGGNGTSGAGGLGGTIQILQSPPSVSGPGTSLPRGGISIAANIDTGGGLGNGTVAFTNRGGDFQVSQAMFSHFENIPPGLNPINIVGLASLKSNGGKSNLFAGTGGDIQIRNIQVLNGIVSQDTGIDTYAVGPITNEVLLSSRGGDATGGGSVGGYGGLITLTADILVDLDSPTGRILTNTAILDSRGGGGDSGGFGGDILLNSTYRTSNSGALLTSGAAGVAGAGGGGGRVSLLSGMHVENSGVVTADGGSSTSGSGGNAALTIQIRGSNGTNVSEGSVTNSAAISASGGSGGITGGNGPNGVAIQDHFSVTNTATLTISGGAGGAGNGGNAGVLQLSSDGSLTSSSGIAANGGAGTGGASVGGSGGKLLLTGGTSVQHVGDITATGAPGNTGGDGGYIRFEKVGGTTSVVGTMHVLRGLGSVPANDGLSGNVIKDGIDLPLSPTGTVTF